MKYNAKKSKYLNSIKGLYIKNVKLEMVPYIYLSPSVGFVNQKNLGLKEDLNLKFSLPINYVEKFLFYEKNKISEKLEKHSYDVDYLKKILK